ncbi:MAG: LytTR family transcriptional regulator DNA-binding domain-containing protein [Saprospiraceae bacterium]|nr:LytTR family transcriptional regulator DNA-binding domain-containing protein [Saprospiraceae bacterium]MBL0084080.1 LytTR family transcriptional regulator DNA-binding domain-containing protein [Saprospiraceae bacterium]
MGVHQCFIINKKHIQQITKDFKKRYLIDMNDVDSTWEYSSATFKE